MAAISTIEIEIKPHVTKSMAEWCVKVLEIFLEQNPGYVVRSIENPDGTFSYYLAEE